MFLTTYLDKKSIENPIEGFDIRSLTFYIFISDKRNSTGNLYFSDSNTPDHPLSNLSNTLQQGSARILRGLSGSQPVGMRDSTSSLSSMNSDFDPNDPQAMVSRELRTAAGNDFSYVLNFSFFGFPNFFMWFSFITFPCSLKI